MKRINKTNLWLIIALLITILAASGLCQRKQKRYNKLLQQYNVMAADKAESMHLLQTTKNDLYQATKMLLYKDSVISGHFKELNSKIDTATVDELGEINRALVEELLRR